MAAEGGPLSVKVTTWVWEHSRSRGAARLVLLAIADKAHDDGTHAWPSMSTLARMTKLSERTVYRSIRELEKLGELAIDSNAGPKLCNLYRVRMTPDTESPLTESHPRQPVTPDRESPLTSSPPTPDIESPQPLTQWHPEPSIEPSRNRQGVTPSATRPAVVTIRPDVDRLCDLLADGVQQTTGERPKVNKRGWTDPARLLIDRDGYTPDQIEALIVWSQGHDFWRSNILSMAKLRDKRLTLIAQIRRETTSRRRDEPASWAALREL